MPVLYTRKGSPYRARAFGYLAWKTPLDQKRRLAESYRGGDVAIVAHRFPSRKPDRGSIMAAIRELSTGAQRVDRPRIRIQPPVPFDRTASAALDDLVLQLEQRPGRWKTRILRLRKLILERRAMGRAGR